LGLVIENLMDGPSMQLTTITSLLGNISVVIALAFIGTALWVWARTRSTHVLVYRLWRWFTDRQEVTNGRIKEFLDDQNSLMSFRFMSGLHAQTTTHAQTLIRTIDSHALDVSDIRLAGAYISVEPTGFRVAKLPKPVWQTAKRALMTVLLSAAILAFLGTAVDTALLRFKSSGTWFALTADSARRLEFSALPLRREDCKAAQSEKTGFSALERQQICEAWRAPTTNAFLTETVSTQRLSFLLLAGLLLFLAWHPFSSLRRSLAAGRVAAQLAKRDRQPALELAAQTSAAD